MCVDPPPPGLGSARCRRVRGGEGRQHIRKHITLQISQIFVWRQAAAWPEASGPLHRTRIGIRCVGGNGGRLWEVEKTLWNLWGRAPEPSLLVGRSGSC